MKRGARKLEVIIAFLKFIPKKNIIIQIFKIDYFQSGGDHSTFYFIMND